jgi:hypothetical protein
VTTWSKKRQTERKTGGGSEECKIEKVNLATSSPSFLQSNWRSEFTDLVHVQRALFSSLPPEGFL